MARPPSTVTVYVMLLGIPGAIGIATAKISALVVILALFFVALLAGLWQGNRFAWSALLALEVSVLVSVPFDAPDWWWIVANVAGLALLLVPQTRRYVWRKPRARQAHGSTA